MTDATLDPIRRRLAKLPPTERLQAVAILAAEIAAAVERERNLEPLINGYAAMAIALTRATGRTWNKDSAFRASRRPVDPLDVRGYAGRAWIKPSALVAWAAREVVRMNEPLRRAARPGAAGDRQLPLGAAR